LYQYFIMNLTLDIGNTQAKLAVFDDKLLEHCSFDVKFIDDKIGDLLILFPEIINLIVCSVIKIDFNFEKYNFKNIHFVQKNLTYHLKTCTIPKIHLGTIG